MVLEKKSSENVLKRVDETDFSQDGIDLPKRGDYHEKPVMHRLPSKSTLRKFRIASIVVLAAGLGPLLFFGFAIYGLVMRELYWVLIAAFCLAGGLLLLLLSFILSARLRCPLCMVPPLVRRGCSKHRDAERLFGSHRFKVATSIIFTNKFRCPYCGERTAMQVRNRQR